MTVSASGIEMSTAVEQDFVAAISPSMRVVEKTLIDIAPTDIPVLIEGESGTGKGAIAVRLHQLSQRRNARFLKVNCATVLKDWIKSQAEADADAAWGGGGTVFLDEVAELDSVCQRNLLHSLPDGPDGRETGGAGVRVVACTARTLEREVRAGRFREDLFYRINGVCLRLPPLRHRREDIPALIDYFLKKYSALLGRSKPEIGDASMRAFVEYSWPGNIRELEHSVQKIVAFGDDRIALADLHGSPRANGGNGGVSLKQAARAASLQAEKELILEVLSQTRWNRKRAAQELRISYKALLYKMKQIGLNSAG